MWQRPDQKSIWRPYFAAREVLGRYAPTGTAAHDAAEQFPKAVVRFGESGLLELPHQWLYLPRRGTGSGVGIQWLREVEIWL
jgi:hypothetical protein